MDTMDKLTKLLTYQNMDIINLEDHIQNLFEREISSLETENGRIRYLSHNDLYDVIDRVTTINDFDTLNIVYDTQINKLRIYNDDEWHAYNLDRGLTKVVCIIKEVYFDTYEEFLIDKYNRGSAFERQCCLETLQDYFKFLVAFGLRPVLRDIDEVSGRLYKYYKEIETEFPLSERNMIKRQVADTLKGNIKSNLKELNRKVMEIMKVDEAFKEKMLL
jgi:hypothetical protein